MKKSFVLHIDSLCVLDDLTNEERGELFYAIYNHHLGVEPTLSPIVKIAFSQFKNQFSRDDEKYNSLCEKNRQIALARHSNSNVTKSTKRNEALPQSPNVTKSTDNKSDSDNKKNTNYNQELFEELWKSYTLGFLKKQGRNGGSKSKALKGFLTLIEKYRYSDIEKLVDNEMSLKFGNRDLERVLTISSITQFLEDSSHIEEVSNRPVRTDV